MRLQNSSLHKATVKAIDWSLVSCLLKLMEEWMSGWSLGQAKWGHEYPSGLVSVGKKCWNSTVIVYWGVSHFPPTVSKQTLDGNEKNAGRQRRRAFCGRLLWFCRYCNLFEDSKEAAWTGPIAKGEFGGERIPADYQNEESVSLSSVLLC